MDGLVLNWKGRREGALCARWSREYNQGKVRASNAGLEATARDICRPHNVLYSSHSFQHTDGLVILSISLSISVCRDNTPTAVYSRLSFGHGMFAVRKASVVVMFILVRISEAGPCFLVVSSIPHPLASFLLS